MRAHTHTHTFPPHSHSIFKNTLKKDYYFPTQQRYFVKCLTLSMWVSQSQHGDKTLPFRHMLKHFTESGNSLHTIITQVSRIPTIRTWKSWLLLVSKYLACFILPVQKLANNKDENCPYWSPWEFCHGL